MIAAACPEALRSGEGLLAPPAFIRFDPPELRDGALVVRAIPASLRESRRVGRGTPLAYLYEHVRPGEPDHDLTFEAGHFDEANLVWSFSGQLDGILGITEPMAPE
ncbi:hypothetical protein [Spirillospora sp. NPDC047279]|uniref:hypothetical protein n=1 Tax=Spirillospora sp. NPDC047279 TaxID=3155478 RepID=UPI0033E0F69D